MNSIIQRLLTETSPWFKKLQIVVVAILVLAFSLKSFIPAPVFVDIVKYGVCIIVFASFTVNDATILVKNGISMQTVFEMAATIPTQLEQLQGAIDGKLTLDQAKQLAGLQVSNPVIPAVVTEVKAPAPDTVTA